MTASPAATAQLLTELTSIGDAVRGQSTGSAGLGQLAAADSPLSVLSAAGFDDVRRVVSFLEEPLSQLAGDPGSVSSAAQDSLGTGNTMSALADSYRASVGQQTSGWSGDAAESYRSSGTNYANGIAALGQAASTVSSAISGAGEAVAQTALDVRQDIADAASQMLPILAAARAQAASTNGASMAQAIPQCVQIAESYGQRIAARMRALLSNGQNLKGFVDRAVQLLDAVKQALQSRTGGPDTGSGPTGGQQPGTSTTTQTAASTTDKTPANQTSANQTSTGQTSSGQASSGQTSSGEFGSSQATPSAWTTSASGQDDGTSGTASDATDTSGFDSNSSAPALTTPQSTSGGTTASGHLASVLAGSGDHSASGGAGSRIRSALGSTGVVGDGSTASGNSATTASAAGRSAEEVPGGSMAGTRGGTRQEDKEHLSPDWLHGESGLFDPDEPLAPEVIDAPWGPDDEDDALPPRRPEPVDEPPVEAPPPDPMTAEVLRRAAALPDAPPRLRRAADAVLEGKFTWEDAAGYRSQHPLAQALFTPKARENLWPMLRGVAEQMSKEKNGRPTAQQQAAPVDRPLRPTEERQR